ncbi:hypothetical protein [Actinacidiphila sp. ITFR-21]|uniref:hypothetical protein n=1 Tax=Actinacidiphila sp. ITFR-21 TaxID=3075199 RepID=UPI002889C8C2|nr:hypothetical protein [Streptomyces sp. ITFR-21]WNI15508.1 hypothetical protein RLT57_08205 [Streptomyces sp. ITFR-21]
MNANRQTPPSSPSPCTPDGLTAAAQGVLTARQLKALGVSAAVLAEWCRDGGPWQQVLPQVYVLHQGPPSGEERVRAALLYTGRTSQAHGPHGPLGGARDAVVTGPAALALHRFASVPPLRGVPVIDVLVPHQRRLRDAGDVRVHRVRELPRPVDVGGLPCAPVPRALADTVGAVALGGAAGARGGSGDGSGDGSGGADAVRRLLTEAVRAGHTDPASVLRELAAAGLLELPPVAAALPALREAGRTTAEQRLYTMVRCGLLPDPVWNVRLRLPGGPVLGGVDAYWPEHAVAVVVDARTGAPDDGTVWARAARQRERLDALGVTLVHLTPAELRDAIDEAASVVRTALLASTDRTPAAYVVVTPR